VIPITTLTVASSLIWLFPLKVEYPCGVWSLYEPVPMEKMAVLSEKYTPDLLVADRDMRKLIKPDDIRRLIEKAKFVVVGRGSVQPFRILVDAFRKLGDRLGKEVVRKILADIGYVRDDKVLLIQVFAGRHMSIEVIDLNTFAEEYSVSLPYNERLAEVVKKLFLDGNRKLDVLLGILAKAGNISNKYLDNLLQLFEKDADYVVIRSDGEEHHIVLSGDNVYVAVLVDGELEELYDGVNYITLPYNPSRTNILDDAEELKRFAESDAINRLPENIATKILERLTEMLYS